MFFTKHIGPVSGLGFARIRPRTSPHSISLDLLEWRDWAESFLKFPADCYSVLLRFYEQDPPGIWSSLVSLCRAQFENCGCPRGNVVLSVHGVHSCTSEPHWCFEATSAIGKSGILIYGVLENLPVSMQAHVQGDERTIFKRIGRFECMSSCIISMNLKWTGTGYISQLHHSHWFFIEIVLFLFCIMLAYCSEVARDQLKQLQCWWYRLCV